MLINIWKNKYYLDNFLMFYLARNKIYPLCPLVKMKQNIKMRKNKSTQTNDESFSLKSLIRLHKILPNGD